MLQGRSLNPRHDYNSRPALQKHYRVGEVSELTGLSIATIYRLMAEDKFPRPINISERSVAWPEGVLVDHLPSLVAA